MDAKTLSESLFELVELDCMIKVIVLYQYQESARFDHDYYRDTHLPLVRSLIWGREKDFAEGQSGEPLFQRNRPIAAVRKRFN